MSANGDSPVTPEIDEIFIDNPNADVILRSSDNVDFRFSKFLLSLASSFFETMFKLPQSPDVASRDSVIDGLPLVLVEEKSRTLEKLLLFCYPAAAKDIPDLTTLEDVQSLLGAAIKYEMVGLEQHVKRALVAPQFAEDEPLRVFAIACRYKLDGEIQVAAKYTLDQPILQRSYIAELEYITGGDLQRVEAYYGRCVIAAKAVGNNLRWLKGQSFVWFEKHSNCATYGCMVDVGHPSGVPVVASQWWWDYLQSTIEGLSHRPCGKEIMKPLLTDVALVKASQCPICRSHAFHELRRFNKLYASEIDRVISEIKVQIQF